MKRSLIKISAIICSLILISSCSDDFLEEEVRSSYTPETLNDALGFEAALLGLYQQLGARESLSWAQGWLSVWQVGTDIVWPTQPQGIEVPYYEYNSLTPDDQAASYTWEWCYNIVENTNSIISNVEDPELELPDMTEEERQRVSAEAKFFRAYAYNMLATLYGGVPIVTEPINEPKTDFVRADISEINELIEDDLDFATQHLPGVGGMPQEARVNKHVASQLFAEFYLRIDEPELAEEQTDNIIESGEFSLIDERYGVKADEEGDPFSDMFWKGNMRRSQGNTEAIWVLEVENPADVRGGNPDNPQHRRVWGGAYHNRAGMLPADSLGGRGLSRVRLNNWVLYDLYDEGDIRNSEHNINRELYYNDPNYEDYGERVPYEGPDTLFIINPYTMKYKHFDERDTFGYGMWKDFMLMRLGETYLLKAEAQFEQDDFEGAASTINILRERADAPMVEAGEIDLDFILDERARELLAEENRRMTLMRTGTLVERANQLNNDAPDGMQIRGLSETNLLLPIPLREIQLNKDADLEQNPGY